MRINPNLTKEYDCMKKLRIVSLIVLVIATVISVDLLINFLGNLVPEMNDGIGIHSVLLPAKLFFGDSLWSLRQFYNAFVTSSLITLAVFVENVVLAIIDITKK